MSADSPLTDKHILNILRATHSQSGKKAPVDKCPSLLSFKGTLSMLLRDLCKTEYLFDAHSNTSSFWFFLFPCLILLGSTFLPPKIISQKNTCTQAPVSDFTLGRKLKPRQMPLLKAQDLHIVWLHLSRKIHSCYPKFPPGNSHTHQEEPFNLAILKRWTNTNLREREVAEWVLPLQGPVIAFPFLPLTFAPRGAKGMYLNSQLS